MANRGKFSVEQRISELRELFNAYGQNDYSDACSKQSHMEQCASLSRSCGDDIEMQVAAFLHDIGHLLAERDSVEGRDQLGYHRHPELGAEYLQALGFAPRIVRLVREHVQAKRYLAAFRPNYLSALSSASLATLEQQGGPMTSAEMQAFAQCDDLKDLLHLRELDDLGKSPEAADFGIEFWLERCVECLESVPDIASDT